MKNLIKVLILVMAFSAFTASAITPNSRVVDSCSDSCCGPYGEEGYWECVKWCKDECAHHVCPVCRK